MRYLQVNPGRLRRIEEADYYADVPCVHRGEATGEQMECASCAGRVSLKLFACRLHGRCSTQKETANVYCCASCDNFQPADAVIDAQAPPCGVVIGSYGYPRLIELQIRTIRDTCGPVPILLSDDRSPNGGMERIRALADQYAGVTVIVGEARIGHSGGDMAAFHRGLCWARNLGLRFVAKLSHRFILTDRRWLQWGAVGLLRSGLAIAGQPCIEGPFLFPLRTEACILDVPRWCIAPILAHLTPRQLAMACEEHVWDVVLQHFAGQMHLWPVITADRFLRTRNVLWHVCTPDAEYHALAGRHGLTMDPDFTTRGNAERPDYWVG